LEHFIVQIAAVPAKGANCSQLASVSPTGDRFRIDPEKRRNFGWGH
jgi:hypothetical protein